MIQEAPPHPRSLNISMLNLVVEKALPKDDIKTDHYSPFQRVVSNSSQTRKCPPLDKRPTLSCAKGEAELHQPSPHITSVTFWTSN